MSDPIEKKKIYFGETAGQHPFAKFINHDETYGSHIIEQFAKKILIKDGGLVVDLGAGGGRDLNTFKGIHPKIKTVAIEAGRDFARALVGKVDKIEVLDLERDNLPFKDESVDIIIANQVLEHTKEVFWIFHEVSRCLKPGGRFIIGVPNIASLHNRLLMLFGVQPTQHKMASAHVRPFTKNDTIKFCNACFEGGYELEEFSGSQFYPFPKFIARPLANVLPTFAFSIFFMFQKEKKYEGDFLTYPEKANLATNFWVGGDKGERY